MSAAPVLVVGLGSPDRGDDAVGMHVARAVAAREDPRVEVLEHEDPTDLVELWTGRERVVVVDAVCSGAGAVPGDVRVLETGAGLDPLPEDAWAGTDRGGTHAFGLATASLRDSPSVTDAALGAGAGFLVVQLVFVWGYERLLGRRGMGEGDAKLLLMIGAFVGWQGALFAVLAGALQGLLVTGLFTVLGVRFVASGERDDDDDEKRDSQDEPARAKSTNGEDGPAAPDGIALPEQMAILSETSGRGEKAGEKTRGWLREHVNQIKCASEALAAVFYFNAGRKDKNIWKQVTAVIFGTGFSLAGLIPEKKIDPEKYAKAGALGQLWMRIQQNPLSLGGTSGYSNTVFTTVGAINFIEFGRVD